MATKDNTIPFEQLHKNEKDYPHNVFLQKVESADLRTVTEELEANPILLHQLHPCLLALFPKYADLYQRLPQTKSPFQEENFQRVLDFARQLPPGSPKVRIFVLFLACLKPAPNDQSPLDPTCPGGTAKYARTEEMIVDSLLNELMAVWDVLAPCGGRSLDGVMLRKKLASRPTEPSEALVEVSRLFFRMVCSSLAKENIEIDFGFAHGGWAAKFAKVRIKGALDLSTFPKRSPSLGIQIFSFYHPRAILLDLLPIVRSLDLFSISLALAKQQTGARPRRSPRQIYTLFQRALNTKKSPIGTATAVFNTIAGLATEQDTEDVIHQAIITRRREIQENGGVHQVKRNEGEACGSSLQGKTGYNPVKASLKGQCWDLLGRGIDTTTLTMSEVTTRYYYDETRAALVEHYGWSEDESSKLSEYDVADEYHFEVAKAFLARNNIDYAGLDYNGILRLRTEVAARKNLKKAGTDTTGMERKEVNVLEHDRKIQKYNDEHDVVVAPGQKPKSAWFTSNKREPQAVKLIEMLDADTDSTPPIRMPYDHKKHIVPTQVDPSAHPSSLVNNEIANGFHEMINQSKGREAKNQLEWTKRLDETFSPTVRFRMAHYLYLQHELKVAEAIKNGKDENVAGANRTEYGYIIDRALFGKLEGMNSLPQTSKGTDCVERGASKVAMGNGGGWKGTLAAMDLKLKLSKNIPAPLLPAVKNGYESSSWLNGKMPCGSKDYAKLSIDEVKWLALFFISTYWYLEHSPSQASTGGKKSQASTGAKKKPKKK